MSWESDSFLMPPFTMGEFTQGDTDEARRGRYRTYLDFYNGLQWLERRKPGERRLTVNYARAFVQKGASYLLGKPVKVELLPNGSDAAASMLAREVEERLGEMWDANGLHGLDYEAAVDAAVLGDGAFKVTWQPLGTVGPLAYTQMPKTKGSTRHETGQVVVRAVDVMGLSAQWRGDDLRRLQSVTETYWLTAGEARDLFGAYVLAQRGLPRAILNDAVQVRVVERWTDQNYRVEVHNKPVIDRANPYGFIPYVIFPNVGRPRQSWGLSDLEDIISLNSEFNVRVSILSQLLQMSGNPVLVLENVDSAENLRIGPGAVWALPEGSRATLLEMLKEGGINLHVKYIDMLYRMIHDLSELPGAGFGRNEASSVKSGSALEILLHPVTQRINRKRRIWDEMLDKRNRMMLTLAGLPVHRSRIVWPDILPRDRAALVTQEVGLVSASIHSLDTARRNLGDAQPELENQTLATEREVLGGTMGKANIQGPVHLSGALVQGLSSSGG